MSVVALSSVTFGSFALSRAAAPRRVSIAPVSKSTRSISASAKKDTYGDDFDYDDFDDYDDFGSADGSGSGGGGGSGGGSGGGVGGKKKKGAAKRAKKSKYDESELPPIAGNVSKLINQKSKKYLL